MMKTILKKEKNRKWKKKTLGIGNEAEGQLQTEQ